MHDEAGRCAQTRLASSHAARILAGMRSSAVFPTVALIGALAVDLLPLSAATTPARGRPTADAIRAIYDEALTHGQAFDHLRTLVANCPGRLAGTPALEQAVDWTKETIGALRLDRVSLQDVMVPHWERGAPESVSLVDAVGTPALTACALGASVATPPDGLVADVVEVHAVDEVASLGRERVAGKIVFFNRPMDPTIVSPSTAYQTAGDQRFKGPAEAAKAGAVGALVRSLTYAHDDVPHTGMTRFAADGPKIPAAALSTIAADRLSAAISEARRNGTHARVEMKIHAQWLPDAPSHNVIGEIRGTEFPEQVIVVGGHLDSWDIAPGAHDDGAGVVQSIEVMRIFRALGLKPRHTIRCVLFVNEENGLAGATAYAKAAQAAHEQHIFALETDAGGFEPHGFSFASKRADAAERAGRWAALFRPYGVDEFTTGDAGSDVTPLEDEANVIAELRPNSQRYFDIHHTKNDSLDKVNPRELQLGAAALAALIYLVDQEGL
jgi:carboxypeptidase Q